MKFTCLKNSLERALATAERFAGKNVTLPVLSHVLLETDANLLRLTATNLEYAVQLDVRGTGGSPGRAAIPAKVASALMQSIQEDKVELSDKQKNIIIKTDAREIRINGVDPEEFPLLPKIKKTLSLRVRAETLCRGIEQVLPASSPSEFKPELAGVFFSATQEELRLAATDTFRLAEKIIPLSVKRKEDEVSFILPHRVCQEVGRVFSDRDDDVILWLGDNQAVFESEGITVISRLVEGTYPDYVRIIPKTFETTSFLPREETLLAVRASSIFASRLEEVSLRFHTDVLEIESANTEVGEHKTKISVKKTGNDNKASFNYHYLLDGLRALEGEDFFIGINNENSPSLLKNKEDTSFLYVIMPIRIT
ncbi:MAG: DNA polymerase III subunit beta [Parcubacteria group bacterium Gr01-1014_33]|nr:MAG: DNA polymerase III subunit beta [Parcubacteria group bacterium Gr01-1014_33]